MMNRRFLTGLTVLAMLLFAMLAYAGTGVAMGNADDTVKSHADYVTTSVDEEGIEYALTALHII